MRHYSEDYNYDRRYKQPDIRDLYDTGLNTTRNIDQPGYHGYGYMDQSWGPPPSFNRWFKSTLANYLHDNQKMDIIKFVGMRFVPAIWGPAKLFDVIDCHSTEDKLIHCTS